MTPLASTSLLLVNKSVKQLLANEAEVYKDLRMGMVTDIIFMELILQRTTWLKVPYTTVLPLICG